MREPDDDRSQVVPAQRAVESEDATVTPAPVRVKVTFPRGGVSIRPNLWHNWARIAIRAERRAAQAHSSGLAADNIANHLESEALESMVAVTAVRHSFHHLYLDWHRLLGLRDKKDEWKVPELATTDLPDDDNDLRAWLADLAHVVNDRDELVHSVQESKPAVPHPLGTNTSELDARFTSQRATEAVDLMLDFYRRVLTRPSNALQQWAHQRRHVLGALEGLRSTFAGGLSRP